MDEDALSRQDILAAAVIWRVVKTPGGVVIEIGDANDELFDKQTVLKLANLALEAGTMATVVVP